MIRRPPSLTRTDSLLPYTALCRAGGLTRAFQLFSDAVPLCRNKRAARPNGDCPPARCRGAPWQDAPSHTSFARVACPWTLAPKSRQSPEIGRAHVCTPVTTAHLVCRLLL